MTCTEPRCNQPSGHITPHGFEAQTGVIFAPFNGTQIGSESLVPVPCDMCGTGVMRMTAFAEGGGLFRCPCGQEVRITLPKGMSTTKFTLFPEKRSPEMEHQRADAWAQTQIMFLTAQRWCGLATVAELDMGLRLIHAEVLRYKTEHPKRWRWWWPWA